MSITYRRDGLFKLLNGLISVYKPPDISLEKIVRFVKHNLADGFNSLPREPQLIRTIVKPPSNNSGVPTITTIPDMVDSDLVLGKQFLPGDFMLYAVDPLEDFVSGVQIFGVGEDGVYKNAVEFERALFLKTYHLTCLMGRASTDGLATGSTLMRASWRHVNKIRLDRVLTAMQAQFNTSSLLHAGLRPNSHTAYLALSKRSTSNDLRPIGSYSYIINDQIKEQLLSPWENSLPNEVYHPQVCNDDYSKQNDELDRRQMSPFVNKLNCINFNPPYFTLEIQVAHETLPFFINLIGNLGPKLRTATLLTKARRIKHGPIGVENSLLLKHIRIPIELSDYFHNYVKDQLIQSEIDPLKIINDDSLNNDFSILKFIIEQTNNKFGQHIFENLCNCTQLGIICCNLNREENQSQNLCP